MSKLSDFKPTVDVKLVLTVDGKEKLVNTLEYIGTSVETAEAVENGLANLILDLNDAN